MADQIAELNQSIQELKDSITAEKAEGQARVAALEAKIAELEEIIANTPGAPDLRAEIAAVRQAAADVSAIFVTPDAPPAEEEVAPPEIVGG
jgi:peptidoglycan hydrolase CwlO-like protein